jgi:hypothetical protein
MVIRRAALEGHARIIACLGALTLPTCLPEGGPGIGARWLEGRGVGVLVGPRTEVPGDFIVFTRADHDPPRNFGPSFELLALGQPGGSPLQLARGINGNANIRVSVMSASGINPWRSDVVGWDLRNRLWGLRAAPAADDPYALELLRMDVATGSVTALGRGAEVEVAPDGKTIVATRLQAKADVYDLDDHVQTLGSGVNSVTFVGSNLFYSDTVGMHQLALPPLQPPRLLIPGGRNFTAVPGHQAEQLFLIDVALESSDRDPFPTRQIGLVRGQDATPSLTVLATGRFLSTPALADEGDRVALLDRTDVPNEVRVRIIDLQSGVEAASTFVAHPPDPLPPELTGPPGPDPGRPVQVDAAFRPRQRDLWIFQDGELAAIVSGGNLVPVARSGRQNARFYGTGYSLDDHPIFTSDGRFWIFVELQRRIRVGDANDPLGPPVMALTEADRQGVLFQETDDGRKLLLFTGSDDRDVQRADLDARRIVPLAHNAGQVEVGRTRIIAILDKLSGQRAPGRLVSVDLATGEETRLADNVVEFKLMPVCPTCDPTGPGVGLQYVVQARLPYRHDGLWKATLP